MGKWRKHLSTDKPNRIRSDLNFFEKFINKLYWVIWNPEKYNVENIRLLLKLMEDWLKTNKNIIKVRMEDFFTLKNAKWKIEESEIPEGEYDWGRYEPSKKCYDCGNLMKTIYLRDKSKSRTFKTIGLFCIDCNKIIIDPKRFEKYLDLLKKQEGEIDESKGQAE